MYLSANYYKHSYLNKTQGDKIVPALKLLNIKIFMYNLFTCGSERKLKIKLHTEWYNLRHRCQKLSRNLS